MIVTNNCDVDGMLSHAGNSTDTDSTTAAQFASSHKTITLPPAVTPHVTMETLYATVHAFGKQDIVCNNNQLKVASYRLEECMWAGASS